MSIQYEQGDLRRIYLQCDSDGCPHTLRGKQSLSLNMTPAGATGWKTVGKGTDGRRDYCAEHTHLA